MLQRCYADDRSWYQGCTVSDEWRYFSNFKKWMESRSWQGKEIDKDILIPGNKVYGKDTCLLVSRHLNNLFHSNESRRGKFPQGVRVLPTNKYEACINKYGKRYYLGVYDTPEEASSVYECARREYIQEVADNLSLDDTSDVEATRAALLRHIELIV